MTEQGGVFEPVGAIIDRNGDARGHRTLPEALPLITATRGGLQYGGEPFGPTHAWRPPRFMRLRWAIRRRLPRLVWPERDDD